MNSPICKHFGTCGGCQFQDMNANAYLAMKQANVAVAFERFNLPTDTLQPVVACAPEARRRVTVSARRTKKTVQVGFYKAQSHDLLSIEECSVLVPELQALLPDLPGFLRPLLSRKGIIRTTLTHTTTGIACAISGAPKAPDAETAEQLASSARDLGICEIAINHEPLITYAQPMMDFGGARVRLPPSSFLQATRAAEQAMQAIISDVLKGRGAKRVADLFSGIGTFTFTAAQQANVHAVEIDQAAVDALATARDRTQGLKEITVEQRNLMKNPIVADRMSDMDAIIFDPPRAGAIAQVREIAISKPATVIAVSCEPSTLARDLQVLTNAGYVIESTRPIDQFAYTPHVETVVTLTR